MEMTIKFRPKDEIRNAITYPCLCRPVDTTKLFYALYTSYNCGVYLYDNGTMETFYGVSINPTNTCYNRIKGARIVIKT